MNFRELGLNAPILRALTVAGYTEPTPIQTQAIPPALAGRDVLGCAQTGTGKTCAFATPILQRLDSSSRGKRDGGGGVGAGGGGIRALILTPTRELAIQIGDSFAAYGCNLSLRSAVIFGGVGQQPQVDAIRAGLDILVATPGRLLDLQGQGLLSLDRIEIFVLDEADRMLDMGFIHDVKRILKLLPEKKQTMLFSATMPPEVMGLVNGLLKDYVRVAVDPVSSPVEVIRQSLYYVDKGNKSSLLAMLLEEQGISSALVFCRTKHGANKIAQDLVKRGIPAAAIHGNKSQTARVQALGDFKAGRVRVLVATDIAARGIDIEEMPCVVNYNLPDVPETYVHRIGRTGRAGHDGIAISFCQFDEQEELAAIQKLLGKKIPVVENHPFPMVNLDPPKKDKNGRPINSEDAEARQAAREKKAAQKAEQKSQAGGKSGEQTPEKMAGGGAAAEGSAGKAKAASGEKQGQEHGHGQGHEPEQPGNGASKQKKKKTGEPEQGPGAKTPETNPQPGAAESSGAKKAKGKQSVEASAMEETEGKQTPEQAIPESSISQNHNGLLSGMRLGKSEEPDDEQWKPRYRVDHPTTANVRQGRLEDTLPQDPSMPRSEFVKPSPLDFDTVIDATARLLSARSADSWRERIRRTEMGEYPEPKQQQKRQAGRGDSEKADRRNPKDAGKQEKPAKDSKNAQGKAESRQQQQGQGQGQGQKKGAKQVSQAAAAQKANSNSGAKQQKPENRNPKPQKGAKQAAANAVQGGQNGGPKMPPNALAVQNPQKSGLGQQDPKRQERIQKDRRAVVRKDSGKGQGSAQKQTAGGAGSSGGGAGKGNRAGSAGARKGAEAGAAMSPGKTAAGEVRRRPQQQRRPRPEAVRGSNSNTGGGSVVKPYYVTVEQHDDE